MQITVLRRRAAALASASLITLLTACGAPSEEDVVAAAQAALAKKDYAEATIQLKSALQERPQSAELRLLLGQTLLKAGDNGGAVVELNKAREYKGSDDKVVPLLAKAMLAIAQGPKVIEQFSDLKLTEASANAELKTALAAAYAAQGNFERCQALVTLALQADAKNVSARLMQARLTAGKGGIDAALAEVESVLAEDPVDSSAWSLKGELLWAGKQDPEAAASAYRKAIAANPRNLSAHSGLLELLIANNDVAAFKSQVDALRKAAPNALEAHFYAVELALVEGDLKRAREGAQRLTLQLPGFAPALQLAGMVSMRLNELELAQTQLAQAVQLAPTVPAARRLLANAQLQSGQPVKALQTLQPLLEVAAPADGDLGLAAQAYLYLGDLAKAEVLYGQAAKANPLDMQSRTALALMQISKGNASNGLAQLDSLAANDKASFADLALISARLQRNELDLALQAIDRLESKFAGKALPHVLRARVMLLRKNGAGARASLDKALAAEPTNYAVASEIAMLDVADGQFASALSRYEGIAAREPNNVMAALAVADLKGRTGAKPAEVEAMLSEIVRQFPDNAQAQVARIQHHLANKAPKAAMEAAQTALTVLPNNPRVLDALGRAQLAAGDVRQALTSLQKAVAMQPTMPEPHMRLADVYASMKDFPAANASLQRALSVAPRHVPAQRAQVQLALNRKNTAEALKIAQEVQKQRPGEPVGYLIEGDILASQLAWTRAAQAYKTALDREPATDTAKRLYSAMLAGGQPADGERFATAWVRDRPKDADFILHLGMMAARTGAYDAAERRYREAMALLPQSAPVVNNVAAVMLLQGKPGALALAEQVNQMAPNQAAFLDTLASAQAAEGQFDKAAASQRRAVSLAPDVPAYRLNLAKYLLKAGDRVQAKSELEQLAAMGSNYSAHAEVAALLKSL